jgi:hypothetical protein
MTAWFKSLRVQEFNGMILGEFEDWVSNRIGGWYSREAI